MRQIHQFNSNLLEDASDTNELKIKVASMPDPDEIYSITLGAADTSNSFVHIPNVRDGDGNIIPPHEYERRLHDQAIVMVNVSLKM
jgi:hypothetical protein